ncbi:hypothetical protein [Methylorubrum aminovorans]|uniref:hypothetical protein n=1 Tax=Methylorubrum aminovorans TaxID=269069 RepID=UPI003C2D8F5F
MTPTPQVQPGAPLGAHDPHDVGVRPEGAEAALLDRNEAQVSGLPEGAADRGDGDTSDASKPPVRPAAIAGAADLDRHDGQDRRLARREPGRDGRR